MIFSWFIHSSLSSFLSSLFFYLFNNNKKRERERDQGKTWGKFENKNNILYYRLKMRENRGPSRHLRKAQNSKKFKGVSPHIEFIHNVLANGNPDVSDYIMNGITAILKGQCRLRGKKGLAIGFGQEYPLLPFFEFLSMMFDKGNISNIIIISNEQLEEMSYVIFNGRHFVFISDIDKISPLAVANIRLMTTDPTLNLKRSDGTMVTVSNRINILINVPPSQIDEVNLALNC